MYLLLVRHGESVDNVAGLFAGSRDSPLTSHGILQIKRLGSHLASRHDVIGPIARVFTSNLQRAYTTAAAVAEAQHAAVPGTGESDHEPLVLQLPELREKDFGSSEGIKFGTRLNGPINGTVQSDSETRDAMMVRVTRFIDNNLVPVFEQHVSEKLAVVVVAHGIILNVLLKALMMRFPAEDGSTSVESRNRLEASEYAVSWSNTGVLQTKIEALPAYLDPHSSNQPSSPSNSPPAAIPLRSRRFSMVVQFTNNIDHLRGLKKTRGGIGSAKFDSRQRTVTSFFAPTSKKRKAED